MSRVRLAERTVLDQQRLRLYVVVFAVNDHYGRVVQRLAHLWSIPRGFAIPQLDVLLIAELMEQLDPQAELRMEVSCPECGESFPALLDAAAFLLQEIGQHAEHLYRQIHSLALHYHWSEAEILDLSPVKRRRYLELLADSLSESQPL